MRKVMLKLWNEERGALIATEWVFVSTILVIGVVAGLKSVQSAIVNELEDVANAIGSLSQGYQFAGTSGCRASTQGTRYTDAVGTYSVSTGFENYNSASAAAVCPD